MRQLATALAAVLAAAPAESRLGTSSPAERDAADAVVSPGAGGYAARTARRDLRERGVGGEALPFGPGFLDGFVAGTPRARAGYRDETTGGGDGRRRRGLEHPGVGEFADRPGLRERGVGRRAFPFDPEFLDEFIAGADVPTVPKTATVGTVTSLAGGGATGVGADETTAAVEKMKANKETEAADVTKQDSKKMARKATDVTMLGRRLGHYDSDEIEDILELGVE